MSSSLCRSGFATFTLTKQSDETFGFKFTDESGPPAALWRGQSASKQSAGLNWVQNTRDESLIELLNGTFDWFGKTTIRHRNDRWSRKCTTLWQACIVSPYLPDDWHVIGCLRYVRELLLSDIQRENFVKLFKNKMMNRWINELITVSLLVRFQRQDTNQFSRFQKSILLKRTNKWLESKEPAGASQWSGKWTLYWAHILGN